MESITESGFDPIEDVVAAIREGQLVVVVDDEDRENEGDLICAAEKITPETVNFMVTHGRGLLCAPVSEEIAARLSLSPMVSRTTRDALRTNYTVTVDAAQGVGTGVSAHDRARTISLLAATDTVATDFVQPGHVNPLIAKPGGVLQRAGHTEASVDLATLAGLRPAAALIEILDETGEPARLPALRVFAKKHNLRLTSIEDLIAWRRRTEKLVVREREINLPTDYGDFRMHLFRSTADGREHLALVKGEITPDTPVLVRVHSECLTGDIFGSQRCDCGWQLHSALQRIEADGHGVLLYMRQEGRGIGLSAKLHAYQLQEEGLDTVEANLKLGYPADLREYGTGAQMLCELGVRKIRLMTNNPKKVVGLEGYGLNIVEQLPIVPESNPHNAQYLQTKKLKMGHIL